MTINEIEKRYGGPIEHKAALSTDMADAFEAISVLLAEVKRLREEIGRRDLLADPKNFVIRP